MYNTEIFDLCEMVSTKRKYLSPLNNLEILYRKSGVLMARVESFFSLHLVAGKYAEAH